MSENKDLEKFTVVNSIQSQKLKKIKRRLPKWLNVEKSKIKNVKEVPIETFEPPIHHLLLRKLKDENIHNFFPVQTSAIREVLSSCGALGVVHGRLGFRSRDICCSAPTGSGKTLAYVLPILHVLLNKVDIQVRCLVVLPTADLATQVAQVFSSYASSTDIKIGLINGLKSFYAEQSKIINNGESTVDILVGTPGRLVDHINLTPGFNLTHLRFLVLDEADRMMDEVKQDWLAHVETAVNQNNTEPTVYNFDSNSMQEKNKQNSYSLQNYQENLNLKESWIPTLNLQKLLFSATLFHDPEKFNQLKLYRPKLIQANQSATFEHKNNTIHANFNIAKSSYKDDEEDTFEYIVPSSLQEMLVECEKEEKVLMLLYLVDRFKMQQVLCFTNSVETTQRLCGLLKLVGCRAQQISSKLNIMRRTRIIHQFHKKHINILLCTDSMCRGMDIVGVDWVVNYDAPRHIRTYVHRAGRTARANQSGTCLSILEKKEILFFKKMVGRKVKELKVKKRVLNPFKPQIQQALKQLQQQFKQN